MINIEEVSISIETETSRIIWVNVFDFALRANTFAPSSMVGEIRAGRAMSNTHLSRGWKIHSPDAFNFTEN